jgi:hypothetical protein
MQLQLIGFSMRCTAHMCLNVGMTGFIASLGKGMFLFSFICVKTGRQPDGLLHLLKHWLLIWDAGTTFDVLTVRYELNVEKY